MKYNFQKGFTLIELMIAIGIIAILATIAMGYYNDNIQQTRCTEGRSALLTGSSALVKCRAVYGAYNNANCNTAAFLGHTSEDHFNVTMVSTATTYTLTATGIGSSAASKGNKFCPIITLNHLGVQGGTGTSPW